MARRSLALLVAVYAGCVGCGDRSEGRPGVPIIVQVRDAAGVMVAGIDVASTFDGVFIDMARTGADGTVEIRVQSGGELTALRRDGYHIGITTILDVADDRLQVIPVERADDATPAVSLPVTVTLGTAGLAGNGLVDAGACRTFGPIPGTVVADVHPDCIQSDGTVSLTAVSVAGTALKNVRGVGILLDVPLDASAPAVLVVSTAALAIIEVPLAVTGPAAAGTSWAVVGVRKGQPIGAAPEGLFAVTSTARLFGIGGAATGLRVAMLEETFPFGGTTEIRQRASLAGMTFDTAVWPAAGSVDLVEEDGRLYLEITDPGPQASFTEVQLYWNDGNVVSHNWFLVAPPPAVAGNRRLPVPQMPEALANMVLDLDADTPVVLDYVSADWIADYRDDPRAQFTRPPTEWTLVRTRTWW